jgi:hypothetical protein
MVLLVLTFSTVFGCIYGLSTAFLGHNLSHASADSKRVLKRFPKGTPPPPSSWKF